MHWLTALSVVLASQSSFAFDIENPSAAVLRNNSDVLNRVVELSNGRAQCSGTWIEKGIILTAAHCLDLVRQPGFRVQGISVQIYASAHRETQGAPASSELLNADLFSSLQDANDYGLILVDAKALKALGLPNEPIEMAAADSSTLARGTDLLISGYGNKAGKKTAAIIQTISPGSSDIYSIISSAHRKFQITASILRGKTSLDTQFSIDFKGRRRDGSMILPGDSGGPAFVQENGKWKLVGVASLIRMMPDLGRQFKMKLKYGTRQFEKKMRLTETPKVGIGDFQDFFLEMMKAYNHETINVDWTRPLGESLVYRQTAEGEVRSYHVSLKDPMIQILIQRTITKFRAMQREVEIE